MAGLELIDMEVEEMEVDVSFNFGQLFAIETIAALLIRSHLATFNFFKCMQDCAAIINIFDPMDSQARSFNVSKEEDC